ncbi:Gfo/Idh/MocA family oxidoreductase [Chitinophagaceae bacterium 26-R-25]|nr:Gfo/Idh/MocA family oxidoreductase [Chitinophagaceae bacterium 26-R-25]
MLSNLLFIEKFKHLRKYKYLNRSYAGKYAFIGIGNHSINNLYPVINYLHIPLKYIVTKSDATAKKINNNFLNIAAVTDLNVVLKDPEIKGVFVCAHPDVHSELVKEILSAGKNVFVEKPVAQNINTLNKLIEVEKDTGKACLVGMQRRYSPYFNMLRKKLNNVQSYNYRFLTGAYPEGDRLLDLFIHPLDIINFLFGNGNIHAVQQSSDKQTLLLQMVHNKVIGTIELSTAYSWSYASEEMTVNTTNGVFNLLNFNTLTYRKKPGAILGLPKEKIFSNVDACYTLLDRSSFLPIFSKNEIYASGYYDEIDSFVRLCEGQNSLNKSKLSDLLPTYRLIEEVKNKLS